MAKAKAKAKATVTVVATYERYVKLEVDDPKDKAALSLAVDAIEWDDVPLEWQFTRAEDEDGEDVLEDES